MNTNPHAAFPRARIGRTGRPTLAILLAIACAFLCASLLLNCTAVSLMAKTAAGRATRSSLGEDEFPSFTEVHSYGSGDAKVVRIPFSGVIMRAAPDDSFLPRADPVDQLLRKLRAARLDDEVEGLLLEIDSPGGSVSVIDEIHHEITRFKESSPDRRIVVLVRDVAASGGYYISLPADAIIAQPTSIIGSIGVIMQTLNVKDLADKIGVSDVTIKSGANKDLLNPLRPVDPDQVAILQRSVDATYGRFVGLVSSARGIPEKTLRDSIADGRIFDATDALKNHLVDAIGYREDAITRLAAELGLDGPDDLFIVTYKDSRTFLESIFSEVTAPVDRLSARAEALLSPRLLYLWRP
jgi:protease-4